MQAVKDVLAQFNLKAYKRWLRKEQPLLYKALEEQKQEVQMASMCRAIICRTDMFGTPAHKKAIKWLSEHNTKGRLF